MQRKRLRAPHLLPADVNVLRLRRGVAAIGINLGRVGPGPKKVEWHIERARRPVGDAAQVPFVTVTARYGDELAGTPFSTCVSSQETGTSLMNWKAGCPAYDCGLSETIWKAV